MKVRRIEHFVQNSENNEEFIARINERIEEIPKEFTVWDVLDVKYITNYTTVAYRECILLIGVDK